MKFQPQIIFRSPINSSTNSVLNTDVFNEALYLSSSVLYNEYQKQLTQPITDSKELKKLGISLYKYQTRASQRCTPFGLFAGISLCKWGNKNNITLNKDLVQTLNRKTRLDMNVLCTLAQELAKQPFIKPYLKFYPNTSIYKVGNGYRYVEYYYINNRRFHKLNKVDFSQYLECILKKSNIGLTESELVNLLERDEINTDEATNFINELIASQLLINQLEPTLTGTDYFDVLIQNLNAINNNNASTELTNLLFLLNEVNTNIKQIDATITNEIKAYKVIHQKLKIILPELSETNLFQTDLYKSAINNNIDSNIQQQIKNTINFLNKISPPTPNKNLEDFRKRFYERYEDYEIPLLLALDNETGVGYPTKDTNGVNDLVEDVFANHETSAEAELKWNLLQEHLLKLINNSISQNKKVIQITEADFKGIDYSAGILPTTFSVMFKVLNATTNKIEINGIGGSSAINLLGRFGGGDTQLENIITEIAKFEQEQLHDKILAEIVHLPESRTGNILARTCFRAYEIPYLAKSSVDTNYQLKMEDLHLRVKGDKIILFDKRLQKEIIPRLGNAHNFSFNSLPVYRFLCDLQTIYFSKPNIGFNWGVLSNQFNFLPRVEFQKTVLTPAKWQLKKIDLEKLQDKKKSDDEKRNLFFELKSKVDLPSKFLIVDGDNELVIDCNNPIAIDTFIDSVKNRNEITLEEYLFEDDHALIKDTDNNPFTNECITIVFNELPRNEIKTETSSMVFKSKQTFSVGSEWLYYKIYCGVKTADFILTEKIKPITEQLLNAGIIDKWFFIRYADPDVHLRFRLHISNFEKYGEVLQLINTELEPLLNQHIISKIQTDTYKRELERYGDSTIQFAEHLFYTDSVFVTNMLDMLDADSGGAIRWQIAIRSVDEFLNDFKLTIEEKYILLVTLSTSFFNEHGGKKELKLVLDNKFRNLREKVEDALSIENDKEKEYYPLIQLINNRSKHNADIITKILLLKSNNTLQLNLNELLASLLHMNLDRLFMGRNRTNEFVVYDLLYRHYKSKMAQLKSNAKKENTVIIE